MDALVAWFGLILPEAWNVREIMNCCRKKRVAFAPRYGDIGVKFAFTNSALEWLDNIAQDLGRRPQ